MILTATQTIVVALDLAIVYSDLSFSFNRFAAFLLRCFLRPLGILDPAGPCALAFVHSFEQFLDLQEIALDAIHKSLGLSVLATCTDTDAFVFDDISYAKTLAR